jgi:hypothetical protein
MTFSLSSRSLLTHRDVGRFPSESLFDKLARAVCRAECLPRKELYEAWEVAKRVRRTVRGGRVVDLACGHALTAHAMLLLDDSSPSALAIDTRIPPSAKLLHDELVRTWPRLEGRIAIEERGIESVTLTERDVVVSVHACGALTDVVLARAIEARARVAVLPCCHDAATCSTGGLGGWMDDALAIDATRVHRLSAAGYAVKTQAIPSAITPKNRLLVGLPISSRRSAD